MNCPIRQEMPSLGPASKPAERGPILEPIQSGGEGTARADKRIFSEIVPANLADSANLRDMGRRVEVIGMGEWRLALSRFRFSWIEFVGLICGVRLVDDGYRIAALLALVCFAILQAVAIGRPE